MRTPLSSYPRRRLLALAGLVVAALVVVLAVVRPWAGTSSAGEGGTYLALGDSVPFGFRNNDLAHYPTAASFSGYPDLVARDLGFQLRNASCPGETTASFLDTSAASFGCENSPQAPVGYRAVYPLHVPYDLPESQLDYALQTLRTTGDVRLITVQLGANDAFLCRQTTADRCAGEAGTVISQAQRNVDTILGALRTRGHYTGRIVVVTYYAVDYEDGFGADTRLLDDALATAARAHGAVVADGYRAFQPAAAKAGGSSASAGLVIAGDVHPTAQGHRLLATAVERAVDR